MERLTRGPCARRRLGVQPLLPRVLLRRHRFCPMPTGPTHALRWSAEKWTYLHFIAKQPATASPSESGSIIRVRSFQPRVSAACICIFDLHNKVVRDSDCIGSFPSIPDARRVPSLLPHWHERLKLACLISHCGRFDDLHDPDLTVLSELVWSWASGGG